jgi:hypothetical protein
VDPTRIDNWKRVRKKRKESTEARKREARRGMRGELKVQRNHAKYKEHIDLDIQ